ncbi:hypothetical protein GE09DRAFT_1243583 [Coniochaeta sp. 2T2.1]|nr:hypothetical protein GE09DRAFT_1243583 [Coniochaeta sp. 2T2.1]
MSTRRDQDPNNFSQRQRWVKTPKRLVFIDETKDVARDVEDEGLEDDDYAADDPMVDSPSAGSEIQQLPPRPLQPNRPTKEASYPVGPASPTDRFIFHEDGLARERRSTIYLSTPIWPLADRDEAILFRHYIQKLAIWLDPCDPRRSFESIVPQRAGTCPILLNAIFALAARHLSHISVVIDPLASNRYHQECLKHLIPMLDHAEMVSDENLFAATIILRVLEEMEVKNMGTDNHAYLLSIVAFVKGGNRFLTPGSLSAACFWVGLRQEIYSAMMNHRTVWINLDNGLVDRSLEPAEDHTWANRAVIHCADVLNFCFGQDAQHAASRWQELDEYSRRWKNAKPPSFEPLYEDQSATRAFPEVWLQSSCHAIGLQHHLLAELFLARFDPKIPKIGANRKVAEEQLTERIQKLARRILGIGIGNQWAPPALFTACMAIAGFGDHFHSREDKQAMLEILKITEQEHARPTETIQHMCR